MSLGGVAVQHREVQGGESDEFMSLFKKCVRYLEGGVASGFKQAHDAAFATRLLQIKGRRNLRVQTVPLSVDSLNSGDVFILDAGRSIFQWNGKSANRIEKIKALEVASVHLLYTHMRAGDEADPRPGAWWQGDHHGHR
jgi:hypothetical protein